MVVKFMDVDTEKITANEYKKHLLIKYEDKPLFIQSNWDKLTHYGVPKNDKFHTTEESRRFIQIPLVENEPFSNFIKYLDEYFSSDKFKTKYLTEKQQKFKYIPILKEGKESYPSSIKLKIIVDDDNNVVSQFFHSTEDGVLPKFVGNMDEIKKVVPYMSEFRFVFKVQKIWFMSQTYGVKLQLMKAQIKPPDKSPNKTVSEFID